jgi:hypothetical protein
VQLPIASAQTPLPGVASIVSPVLLTVKVAARAFCAAVRNKHKQLQTIKEVIQLFVILVFITFSAFYELLLICLVLLHEKLGQKN